MSIKGVVEAIRWQFVKLINMFLKLQTIHWMPQENINLSETFDKYNNDEFYFVQIGANDGITGDSLRKYIEKYEWRGILVEPVPYVFKRLMDNYKGFQNLHFENAAVSSKTGHSKFYSVNEYDLDNNNLFEKYDAYKIDQLSSFDLKTVMKHSYMHPNFEKLITEVDIPTISFDDLINKCKVH
jgi:FkbM family methyltransferase